MVLQMNSIEKGNFGELHVAAQLAKRGWIVAFPPYATRSIDLLAFHPVHGTISIQVKTKTVNNNDAKLFAHGSFCGDFLALVWAPEDGSESVFFYAKDEIHSVVPSKQNTTNTLVRSLNHEKDGKLHVYVIRTRFPDEARRENWELLHRTSEFGIR